MTLNVMWPNYTLCSGSLTNTTCGPSDIMHNNALLGYIKNKKKSSNNPAIFSSGNQPVNPFRKASPKKRVNQCRRVIGSHKKQH